MYKKAVNRRSTPQQITAEDISIVNTSNGYMALITEDPQENTPSTSFVCVKDMTAKAGCTVTNILVNEAIDSTQASIWVGQMLGFNGEMRTIASVTPGTAGNASFSVSAFNQAPTAGNDIYSPREEQRDNNPVAVNYFKVRMNDNGEPLPELMFNAADNAKVGKCSCLGMGTTISDMYVDQMSDMYDKTQSERMLEYATVTDLLTNSPASVDLKGTFAYITSVNPRETYQCTINDTATGYEWRRAFSAPSNFVISSTNVQSGSLATIGNVTVTFSVDVAPSTVIADNIKIKKTSDNTDVITTLSISSDNKTITVDPSTDLTNGTSYYLWVSKNLSDAFGNPLSNTQDFTQTFIATVDPAPTAATITSSGTEAGQMTARMTVASTDATVGGDTVTYDYYADGVAIVGHTDLTEAQAMLDRILLTGLTATTAKAIKLVAKDTHGNSTDSNIVNVTIPVPVTQITSVTAGNAQNTIAFAENTNLTGETYDLYFSTTTNVAADIKATGTKITVTSPYVHSPLVNGTQYNYILVTVYNSVESNSSSVFSGTPSATTYTTYENFEGTINGANVTVGSGSTVAYSTDTPINGTKSLLIDKSAKTSAASYTMLNFPQTPANVEFSFDLKVGRLPVAGDGVTNYVGTNKEWAMPVMTVVYQNGANWYGAFVFGLTPDGYLMASYSKDDGSNLGVVMGAVTLDAVNNIVVDYNRTTKTLTIKQNGTTYVNNVNLTTATPTESIGSWSKLIAGASATTYYSGKFWIDNIKYSSLA